MASSSLTATGGRLRLRQQIPEPLDFVERPYALLLPSLDPRRFTLSSIEEAHGPIAKGNTRGKLSFDIAS
jgi:hypothetical protein